MNKVSNNQIIFSAELSHLSDIDNLYRVESAIRWLNRNNIKFEMVLGCYENVKEVSFICDTTDCGESALIKNYAFDVCHQESILIKYGEYVMLSFNDEQGERCIGKWTVVPEQEAHNNCCYTYNPNTEQYFLCK